MTFYGGKGKTDYLQLVYNSELVNMLGRYYGDQALRNQMTINLW